MEFVFTKYALKQWQAMDPNAQKEIQEKISELKTKPDLFAKNIKRIFALEPATHRLRVGNFRLLLACDFLSQKHIVLKIGHRREIYL